VSDLLSIIVPVFNEQATIAEVIDRLRTIALPIPREIIVVNDGSRDGTGAVLTEMSARDPQLTIVNLAENRGKGHAVRTGLSRSRGSITAIQDADLELDPSQLAELIGPILRGEAAAVYGSRFLAPSSDTSFMTRAGNAALTWVTNRLYGQSLTDMETCYKIMRGDVARSLPLTANRFDIEPEITVMLLKAGHRIVEQPVTFSPRSRAAGKKIRWRDGWQAIRVLVRHRF
jgi:glycosyltransferase involved in cell wall biosynthesis